MAEIFETLREREIASCFSLAVPTWLCKEEIEDWFSRDMRIKRATKAMLNGSITLNELFEVIEPDMPAMDLYQDELSENLESFIQESQIQWHKLT